MPISRRALLGGAAAVCARAASSSSLKLGSMDTVFRLRGKPEALAVAKTFGLEGVQVTIGNAAAGGRLPLADPGLQARYLAESARHGVPINSTYLDILHVNCLKDDPLAPGWVRQGIGITRALKSRILMTVFFGKCTISTRAEIEAVVGAFRQLAPEAERAGVVLGFENLLKAEDNLRVMDRVASPAFQIYYDVGNAANLVGADPAAEIRQLGRRAICQFHFKDQGYLGEGKVNFRAVLDAIAEIGFEGFANLETSAPSGSVENDVRRNVEYLRRLM